MRNKNYVYLCCNKKGNIIMNGKNARDLRKMAVVLATAGDTENKVTPREIRGVYQGLKKGFYAESRFRKQLGY